MKAFTLIFILSRHSGVPGGRQSPVTVGAGFPIDPSTTGNRPLAELCELTFSLLLCTWAQTGHCNIKSLLLLLHSIIL